MAKATKPLVAMVARQVQSTLFSIPHLLVPANFVNPYQASGDVYGKQVHLLTSGDQTHESSRIVAKKEFEARAKGKINRYTAKYAEVSYGDLSVTVTEKAKPQQQFICEEGSLAAVSTQDYQEIGCATEACGNMLRGSLDANASFGALELHTKTVTTETRSGGFFSGPKTIVTTSESSNFLANKAYSGGNSQIIGKNVSQVGVEEHAGDELVYKSGQLVLDAAVGINRTQTTATTKGAFSTRTQKSLMEMPVFVRNLLSAQTIRFEGQDSANIRGAAITADTVMDQTKKGATFGPTVSAMRYEISDSTRTPMAATNHGTRGGQELMAPTAFNVRRIVRSASFDGVSPGKMEFVSCVWQDRERVEILGKYQESVYILKKWQESWAHHHQVIPNEAISVLAIAVSLSTQGIGSAFFTNTLGFSSLGATMGSAGLKYLISSAATSLAQTGDLEGTLKNLASDRALRGLAISIASAGLTQKLAGICEIPLDTKSLELIDHVKAEGLRAGVTTAVTLAISKDDPSDILRQGLMSFAGNTLGAFGASHIGAAYAFNKIDPVVHKALHTALGGASGAVTAAIVGGDIKLAALSGATGALIAETVADMLKPDARSEAKEAAGKMSREQFEEKFMDKARMSANWGNFAAAVGAFATGLDVGVAYSAAHNATEHNTLGQSAAVLAVELYETYQVVYAIAAAGGLKALLDTINVKSLADGFYSFNGEKYKTLPEVLEIVAAAPIAQTKIVVATIQKMLMDIDPNAGKPTVIETPIHEPKPLEMKTPIAEPQVPFPGYEADPNAGKGMSEGFDISDMPEIQIFDKAHVLYGKPGPKGEPDYIGRTSGEASNDADIKRILENRDRNHHMNDKGFGEAERITVSDDPAVIRGLEQMYIDKLGGAQSMGGSSSNAINSIGKNNPKREEYLQAAKKASEDA